MLTAVLCLVDIIKDNETLTEPFKRGQRQTQKSVQYKCKLPLLDTCFLSPKCCLIFPVMKNFVTFFIYLCKYVPPAFYFSGRQDEKS